MLCDAVAQSIYAVGRVVSVEDGTLAISASPKRTLKMLSNLTLYLPSKVIQQQRNFFHGADFIRCVGYSNSIVSMIFKSMFSD